MSAVSSMCPRAAAERPQAQASPKGLLKSWCWLQSREQAEEWLKVQRGLVPSAHLPFPLSPSLPQAQPFSVWWALSTGKTGLAQRVESTFHRARALCGNEPWMSQETDLSA